VFNATFSNVSSISWRQVLVVEEAGVPGENICTFEGLSLTADKINVKD